MKRIEANPTQTFRVTPQGYRGLNLVKDATRKAGDVFEYGCASFEAAWLHTETARRVYTPAQRFILNRDIGRRF